MMLTGLFTKAIRDRWLGMSIATFTLAVWLIMAMGVYREVDTTIYTSMPDVFRELIGIPEDADVAVLSYAVLLSFAGALTLAGMAVSMGAASIAGEERMGTIGLLLGNPRSRLQVLAAKAGAMVLLVGLGTLAVWGAAHLAPVLLGVEIGETRIGAMMLHLVVNAWFYGFLAMAVGAWTGNRSRASGVAAGVMAVSYVAVGLLPLIEGAADFARVFPWYYFDGSDPLVNGVAWGHIAVLTLATAALAVVAVVGVQRRDLEEHAVRVTLLDRLRTHPLTRTAVDRLAGSTRVSRIWIKTASEHQGLLVIVAYTMFAMMGVLIGPIYNAIDDTLADFAEGFPEALMAIAGGGDMTTPEGWYQVETFSLMAPIAVMVLTVLIGSRALAGEEERRTMGLLLANPIPRSRIVLEKALTMTVSAAVVGFATWGGVALGSLIAGLGMSMGGIAAASALVALLGIVFGAAALLLGAATGRSKVAVYGAIGLALTSHLLASFLPLSDRLAGWAKWTPNYYYLSGDPLTNGMPWGHAGALAAMAVVLIGLAVILFDRRDLRQTG